MEAHPTSTLQISSLFRVKVHIPGELSPGAMHGSRVAAQVSGLTKALPLRI